MRQRRLRDRTPGLGSVTISYPERGRSAEMQGTVVNVSSGGLCIKADRPIPVGSAVAVEGSMGSASGNCTINSAAEVRWCTYVMGGVYRIGLELPQERAETHSQPQDEPKDVPRDTPAASSGEEQDYYDILQLGRNADSDTINRVFRILAARYHPDNSETGDAELFRKVVAAHEVLSDRVKRAAYDANHANAHQVRWKVFENAAVSTGIAGERRKRTALLSALYTQRVNDPSRPGVTLREMEQLLGCPCEHLEFTVWYLRQKQYITSGDNGRLMITVSGIDAAEELSETAMPGPKNLLPMPAASSH